MRINLFTTPEYLQDRDFGGAKYAGIKALQRLDDVKTIDQIFSPGFEVYDGLVSGKFGNWLKQAYQQRDIIMQAYEATLRDEDVSMNRVKVAYEFFGVETFSEIRLTDAVADVVKPYLSEEKDLAKEIAMFMEENSDYLYRSSADIEDEEVDTAGLFEDVWGESREIEDIIDEMAAFYGQNLAISIFRGRPARLNFVLCKYLEHDSGGVGFSDNSEGPPYLEVAGKVAHICKNGQTSMNIVQGTVSDFTISLINQGLKAKKEVCGVKSYASEDQLVATLSLMERLESLAGFPVHTEFLFEKGETDPTILQIRRNNPKVSDEKILDKDYFSADYSTKVALKPGDVEVPLFSFPHRTYIGEDGFKYVDRLKMLEAIKKIDCENPEGYGLFDDNRMTMKRSATFMGDFYVTEMRMEYLRRVCNNVKVFINNNQVTNRGGHGMLNMASDETSQFYLSIPRFEVKDGTLAKVRSDGRRGIVNIVGE